jgi:predicted alpha/beta-hydrolase family hydrolase
VVYANIYGTGERGLVLAHGGRFNKESWEKQARTFASAGFRVLAFDFRAAMERRTAQVTLPPWMHRSTWMC